MNKSASRKKAERNEESKGLLPWLGNNRPLLLLSLFLLATVAYASYSSNRIASVSTLPMPTGTPPSMPASAPAKEYVYAGSSLISTLEPFREAPDDLAVWRPSTGTWYILNSQSQWVTEAWGISSDIPAPGDFDGDGKTDFCVFRESTGIWYIIDSSTGTSRTASLGSTGDKPVPADFDGDGRSDIAVWRPSTQNWYITRSSDSVTIQNPYGISGDTAVPADYDGDGKSDLAVWRDSTATFWVYKSSNAQSTSYTIGQSGDEPVIGDYDGDGITDVATRRAGDNIWRIYFSGGGTANIAWGQSGDRAVPGRYRDSADTDAKTDVAVWRPSTGVWYIRRSSDLSTRAVAWGTADDIPVPAAWKR